MNPTMSSPPPKARETRGMPGVMSAIGRSSFLWAAILFLVILPFYLAPSYAWNSGPAGDTVPAELLPIAILHNHSVDFDQLIRDHPSVADPNHLPYFLTLRNGRVVSFYPLVPGLMNLPVYALADHLGYDLFRYRFILSHLSSSLICALASALMFLALDALCDRRRVAIVFTLIFALGTEVWSEASRGMWQHGPSILLLAGTLAILLRNRSRGIPLAGVLLGLAIWNRPTNVLMAGPIAVYVVFAYCRQIASFLCAMAVPLLFMAIYSYLYLGSVMYLGQGRDAAQDLAPNGMLRAWLIPDLEGLIFSPNRGLLVFTPIFAFGLIYLLYATFSRRENPLFRCLFVGLILMLFCYGHWYVWWGGYCFGYRLLAELVPILTLATAMSWERWLSRWRLTQCIFALLTAWSIYVHFLGIVYYHLAAFNWKPNSIDQYPGRLWDIKDGEIARDQSLFFGDVKTLLSGHGLTIETPRPAESDQRSSQ